MATEGVVLLSVQERNRREKHMSDEMKSLLFWILVLVGMGFAGGVERGYFF